MQPPAGGEPISVRQGEGIKVPDHPIIPFIEGDGTGPDIWKAAQAVIDAAVAKSYGGKKKIAWMELYAGDKAKKIYGDKCPPNLLPVETIETIRTYKVAIKGPLTTPIGEGIRSLNVTLRQELDLYACVRPVKYYKGVPSPVKEPEKINMMIFRENTEDVYAGIEWNAGTPEARKIVAFLQKEMGVRKIRFPETSSIGIKPVSSEGTKRLVRAALRHAVAHGSKNVTLVHKGNIMKFTEGGFRKWGYEVAQQEFAGVVRLDSSPQEQNDSRKAALRERLHPALPVEGATRAPQIVVKDVIADAFLQQILTRPAEYDVIATLNLNGDYISDALAAQVGGIGIAPGGNINFETGHAVFEATHGTAPKYAGQDKVNPSSVILSGVMMLDYLGWAEAARLIEKGLEETLAAKIVTYDFARLMEGAREVKCSEFGQEIITRM